MKQLIYIVSFLFCSTIVFANNEFDDKLNDLTKLEKIYPNPIQNGADINLKIHSQENIAVKVYLIDLIGNVVYENNFDLNQGRNTIVLSNDQFKEGIYFLHILNGDNVVYHKVVVE